MNEARRRFLPYGRQEIDDQDIAAVAAVLRGDFLTTGPTIAAFETALAKAVDAPHAVVCGNGTQALHLAGLAAGLDPGDWAIVPTVTFLATANAVRYVGAEVVFADVDPETGLTTPEHLMAAAARAKGPVKTVLPVHLGGLAADPESIARLAQERDWVVIEDACHALGTEYRAADGSWRRVGDAREAACCVFSFHPVKTIAMGEGGAVTTRDEAIAARMRSLRSHGMVHEQSALRNRDLATTADGSPNPWYYEMQEIGFNYRAPDLACALGLSQLKKLDRFVTKRRALVARYRTALAQVGNSIRLIDQPEGVRAGWHLCRVLIDFASLGVSRAHVMMGLRDRGIGSQVHYIPVHLQPYYRDRYGDCDLPGARRYYERCLSLPLFPAMTESDVDDVVAALRMLLKV